MQSRKTTWKHGAALVAAAIALTGIGCAKVPGATGLQPSATNIRANFTKGGSWTVLVHVAADNNLYEFAAEDINEMEAGIAAARAKGDQTRFILLYDGLPKGDSCVMEIMPDPGPVNTKIVSKVIDDGGALIPASKEIDSGDAKLAAKFAAWGAKFAPADHTMLSFWDHGSGIFKGGPAAPSKGYCWDDSGTFMETKDLGPITGAFKAAAGKNLTAFLMDACLMSHVELAYQAKDTTDYMIASEELEPGHGYDYQDWMKRVAASDHSPKAVLSALVDSGAAAYAPGGAYGEEEVTFALTDIRAVEKLVAPAMNNFARVVQARVLAAKPALLAARGKTQHFNNDDCVDLIHYGEQIAAGNAPADVKAAAAAMTTALRTAVVREVHTPNFTGARGLVAYFPTPGMGYNKVYDDPTKIAFAKEEWKGFLKALRK